MPGCAHKDYDKMLHELPVYNPGMGQRAREGYEDEWFGRRAVVLVLHHERQTVTWGFFPDRWNKLAGIELQKLDAAIERITKYYLDKGYSLSVPPPEVR